jgi:hypothetical protein
VLFTSSVAAGERRSLPVSIIVAYALSHHFMANTTPSV